MRILVVEDEVQLAEAVARGLRREGMAVDVATDGDEGYRKAALTRYDVVVLDRDLPGMSGDEICRRLTDEGVLTRVMMLTASGTVEDKVTGLAHDAGRAARPHRGRHRARLGQADRDSWGRAHRSDAQGVRRPRDAAHGS